jgi:WD40 repeat protein
MNSSFEKLREIKNIHGGKIVNAIEISPYHNVIVTSASGSNSLIIWNFEFLRIIA